MTARPQITLYAGGPGFDLPDVSPFCTKTEVQLKMAGLPYRKEAAMPDASPKGQLPFIEDAGVKVADSTFIRVHIERKYGFDFDAGLGATERAQAWALERMLENQLYFALVYFRWLVPENFAKGPAQFFSRVPEAIREQAKRDALTGVSAELLAAGITRHRPDEIVWLGERSLAALSALLGDRPYLFGDRVSGVDATAFGVLAGLMTPYFESPLRRRAENYGNLAAYVDRMTAAYFPAHSGRRAA
jgi:glutathione S-transferase